MIEQTGSPRGYGSISLTSTTAVGLSFDTASASRADFALIRCEGGNCRWRDDGTDSTSTAGFLLNEGEVLEYDSALFAIKFARTGSSTVTVHYALY